MSIAETAEVQPSERGSWFRWVEVPETLLSICGLSARDILIGGVALLMWLSGRLPNVSSLLYFGIALLLFVALLSLIQQRSANVPRWVRLGGITGLSVVLLAIGMTAWASASREHLYGKPVANAEELSQSYISGRTVRIVDVPRTEGAIFRKTFEDCIIIGPAVTSPWRGEPGPNYYECSFFSLPEQAFMVRGPMEPLSVGVIGLVSVDFKRCEIRDVGLITLEHNFEQLKKSLRYIPPTLPELREKYVQDQEMEN